MYWKSTGADDMTEKILLAKIESYKKKFGDGALREAIKEQDDKYSHFGVDDYMEVVYNKGDTKQHLLFVGDILELSDYFLAKINSKYDMVVVKKINGKYEPLLYYEKEEFI